MRKLSRLFDFQSETETEMFPHFTETETLGKCISRPSRDQDVETETTSLVYCRPGLITGSSLYTVHKLVSATRLTVRLTSYNHSKRCQRCWLDLNWAARHDGLSHRCRRISDHRWLRRCAYSPILDAHARPQMSHWKSVLLGVDLDFRWLLFASRYWIRLASKCCTESLQSECHPDLSAARSSSSLGSMSHFFKLAFRQSLKRFLWPPQERVPCCSSL